jgi:hypothetical protein
VICFPDTNVVFKLAGFDLLHEALSVLAVAPQDLFILQETRKMCLGTARTSIEREYGRQAIPRVEGLMQAAGKKPSSIDPDELEILTYADGIDAGEAVLFAATRNHTEFLVVTDDKNSLRALAEEPDCEVIFERIRDRVICLEDLLLRILAQYPYEQVRHKLLRAHHCVGALSQTLGQNQHAGQLQVENALRVAMERLRLETNYILAPPTPRNP